MKIRVVGRNDASFFSFLFVLKWLGCRKKRKIDGKIRKIRKDKGTHLV